MILIAGFALAVTLIALAMVMNAAIYTENLATRSESPGARAAQSYERAVSNAALEAFRYTNAVNDSAHHEMLRRNVTAAVSAMNDVSTSQQLLSGQAVNYSVAEINNGTRIVDSGGDFTNKDGLHNWTLAQEANHTKQFTIEVRSPDAELNETGRKEFRVVAHDRTGSGTAWMMNISFNTSRNVAVVGVHDGGGYDTCDGTTTTSFRVNVSAGTVAGNACPALDFSTAPDTFDLEFRNASAIQGEYSLIVDRNVTDSAHFDASGPTANALLYSMRLDLVYRTPNLRYRSTLRIAPGETDD